MDDRPRDFYRKNGFLVMVSVIHMTDIIKNHYKLKKMKKKMKKKNFLPARWIYI
jgi:hypothetical protein